MVSTKLYGAIFVVLFLSSSMQAAIELTGLLEQLYWIGFAVIIALSFMKAVLVAGWFQHLYYEPRSLTYLILTGLAAAIVLTLAASYSIL